MPTRRGSENRIGIDRLRVRICVPMAATRTYKPFGRMRSLDSLGGARPAIVEVKECSNRKVSVRALLAAYSNLTAEECIASRSLLIWPARRSVGVGEL